MQTLSIAALKQINYALEGRVWLLKNAVIEAQKKQDVNAGARIPAYQKEIALCEETQMVIMRELANKEAEQRVVNAAVRTLVPDE